ncbi:thioredoxin family protein [bacterium]|nr:thioredoxin family protein [bacterium]
MDGRAKWTRVYPWMAAVAAMSMALCEQIPAVADHPRELGRVSWERDFGRGADRARSEKKPILMLFQEVPGCATCVGYGQMVLSHPLVVEAIESLFVPVAIYNNGGGEDAATLKKFREPAWNNPVVRIVSTEGSEIAPRLAGDYSIRGLLSAMSTALRKLNRPIPPYLQLLAEEYGAARTERGTFAMACFWAGEGRLGSLPGVLSTRPGFSGGHEVVEVVFNPGTIPYDKLVSAAKSQGCALRVFAENDGQRQIASEIVGRGAVEPAGTVRPDAEPKYYLSQTPLKFVPLSATQSARVNAAIGMGLNPDRFLSPRQIDLWAVVQRYPNAGWKSKIGAPDIARAWDEVMQIAARALTGKEKQVSILR